MQPFTFISQAANHKQPITSKQIMSNENAALFFCRYSDYTKIENKTQTIVLKYYCFAISTQYTGFKKQVKLLKINARQIGKNYVSTSVPLF